MVSQEAAADLARERGRQEVARGKRQLQFSQGPHFSQEAAADLARGRG
jgi:hypothetical protein